MEKLWGLGPVIARDPDFATVNLPWNGIFLTAEGKPVDAFGLPVQTLPRPVPATQKPDPCRLPLAPAARRPLRRVHRDSLSGEALRSVVCGHCNHVWGHTGIKPTAQQTRAATRGAPG